MPFLTPFPSTALASHSLQATGLKLNYEIMTSFALYLSADGLPCIQLVSPISLCQFLKIKHSPGCSWHNSNGDHEYTTGFGGAKNAGMPLLTLFPSTVLEDWGAKGTWTVKSVRSFQATSFEGQIIRVDSRSTFSVVGFPSMHFVTVTALCRFFNIQVRKLQYMVIMMVHHPIWKGRKCRQAIADSLSFYCPRRSWSQRDTDGPRPSFSFRKKISNDKPFALYFFSGRVYKHAFCHCNCTLSALQHQALTLLFLTNIWDDALWVCLNIAEDRKLQ